MSKKKEYKTDFTEEIKYSNKDFCKILDFYLFHCPVEGVCKRGKTFSELGWTGRNSFGKLKKSMMNIAGSNVKDNYYPCDKGELEDLFKKCTSILPPNEYCVFLKHDEKTVMQSLFGAIRNAFAHGSFNINTYNKQRIYYFENYSGYLKAKIVLKEDTLLEWIDLVTR